MNPSFYALLGLGLFWLDLSYQLSAQWALYPQYSYGWAIPFLAAFFLWRRWRRRPLPELCPCRFPLVFLIVFLAVGFFATRFVQEANLIWRLPIWLMALQVVGITLAAFYLAGGKIWLKHFAFPVLFFLIAVPWLRPIEEPLIQALTDFNARASVEIFSLLGIPVFQQANVIETSRGLVGIDEACSGVRSFQATMMLALLFGEFYFLNFKHRGKLLLAGIALAVGSNILRTTTLVFVCTQRGLQVMGQWHDPTGVAILVICFTCLWFLSQRYAKKDFANSPMVNPVAFDTGKNPGNLFPAPLLISLGVCLVISELATEFWYRQHEIASTRKPLWQLRFPENTNSFRAFEISKVVSDRLKYDEGHALAWKDNESRKWQMLYFRWQPADSRFQRVVVQDGKNHAPESCLSRSGKKVLAVNGLKTLQADGISLPFQSYVFEDQGERMHVYFCLWQDYFLRLSEADYAKFSRQSPRLAAVAAGNRSAHEGLQVLELAVWGIDDDLAADKAAQEELQKWVKRR